MYNRAVSCELAIMRATSDSLDGSLSAAAPHFEMRDASFSEGALFALAYVAFVVALTSGAIWIWPRLGPWIWAHI